MENLLQKFMRFLISTPDANHTFHLREILVYVGFISYCIGLAIRFILVMTEG